LVGATMDKIRPRPAPLATPFVRWPGSKRNLLPTLLGCAPRDYSRYVEPFLGSACLFFALAPPKAVLADNNALLISAFEAVRDHPVMVSNYLAGREISPDAYYAARARLGRLRNPTQRSKTFLYLNRLCFNGVFRTNRSGHFNVPFGSRTGAMPSRRHLVACSRALKPVRIEVSDFEDTLARTGTGDFVYLDPPYFKPGRSTYGEYGYGCFSENDLGRLVKSIRSASCRGARILLSYSNDPRVVRAFSNWDITRVSAVRTVSADYLRRTSQRDLLFANFVLPRVR